MIAALSSCSLRFCSSESPDLHEPVCGGPSRSTTSVSSGIYLLSLGQYHYKENRTQVRNLRGEVQNNFLLRFVRLGTEHFWPVNRVHRSKAEAKGVIIVKLHYHFDVELPRS